MAVGGKQGRDRDAFDDGATGREIKKQAKRRARRLDSVLPVVSEVQVKEG